MVDDYLHSYDSLVDDSPAVIRNLVKSKQASVIIVVETRFPALRDLAQQKVSTIRDLKSLDHLLRQAAAAPDEETMRWVFNTYDDAA